MSTTPETAVYDRLYQIAEQNIRKAGREMPFAKSTLLAAAGTRGMTADISRLQEIPDRDFQEAAYAVLLRRLPLDPDYERAEKQLAAPDFVSLRYRQAVVRTILNSAECRKKGVDAFRNVYSEHGDYGLTRGERLRRRFLDGLYAVYRHLPEPVKNLARKALKGG